MMNEKKIKTCCDDNHLVNPISKKNSNLYIFLMKMLKSNCLKLILKENQHLVTIK